MTTLQTFKAFINGILVNVDQLHGNSRQAIFYRIHSTTYNNRGWEVKCEETTLNSDDFWKLNPLKV